MPLRFSLLIAVCLVVCTASPAQNIVTLPRNPSPAASISQTIGIATVTVDYSRPSVRGRKIWGALVPYGWNKQPEGEDAPAPWRAGANENTTITFTRDGTLEGKPVPAGKYGLFLVINEDNTGEVILSKDNHSWGNYHYVPGNDLFRAPIRVQDGPMTETLTYVFDEPTKTGVKLLLCFEKKQFPLTIHFDTDELVMKNAAEELKGLMGFYWQPYESAARYAAANNVNNAQALQWIDASIAIQKNFKNLMVKSKLLAEAGKADEARAVAAEASALATESDLDIYGYQLLEDNKPDEALQVFILNTQRNPKSPNVWESLGEAYAQRGDKKNAIANFKKSLSLNPAPAVRAAAEKFLKQLQ